MIQLENLHFSSPEKHPHNFIYKIRIFEKEMDLDTWISESLPRETDGSKKDKNGKTQGTWELRT